VQGLQQARQLYAATTINQAAQCRKSPPAADEEMELLDEGDDEEERGGKRKRTQKNALTRNMPSAKVQEGVQKDLLRSVIMGEDPFRFLNNKFLKGDFAAVGVHMKKRVYLSNRVHLSVVQAASWL